jgi:hypothetical protein
MTKRDLDLERKWRITFDEYKKSGQSVKGWCEKNGIIPTTFRYWIKRFTSEEFQPVNTQFAKVILQPNCTNNKDASTTSEDFSKTETTKHVQHPMLCAHIEEKFAVSSKKPLLPIIP